MILLYILIHDILLMLGFYNYGKMTNKVSDNDASRALVYTVLWATVTQADARRRNLVQLRLFDRFDVCILKN